MRQEHLSTAESSVKIGTAKILKSEASYEQEPDSYNLGGLPPWQDVKYAIKASKRGIV